MKSQILKGDSLAVLKRMPDASVQTCVTSPPYWGLRDYGVKGQLGLEKTPEEYVERMVEVFREVRRVLKDDGTLWLNLGDSFACAKGSGGKSSFLQSRNAGSRDKGHTYTGGLPPKNLVGIPWRVAFALQADGWILRSDIIWHKPNPMPESVTDRPTKAHEYIFLFAKSEKYFFNRIAFAEPCKSKKYDVQRMKEGRPRVAGKWFDVRHDRHFATSGNLGHSNKVGNGVTRNRRTVWTVTARPFKGAHFATFPPALIEPCILAGAPKGGVVLDPFFGAGTTGLVADAHDRQYIGIELNSTYIRMAQKRIETAAIEREREYVAIAKARVRAAKAA